jgi:hypothetical protein
MSREQSAVMKRKMLKKESKRTSSDRSGKKINRGDGGMD